MDTPAPSGPRDRRSRRTGAIVLASALAASAVGALDPAPAGAGSLPTATRMVTREADGSAVNGTVGSDVTISDNGRFVAFTTTVKIVATDTNGERDVYVRDLWAGVTDLVSLTDAEQPIAGESSTPSISDDGRFVSFISNGSNLIPGDDKGLADVFVRDRFEGTTRWMNPGVSDTVLTSATSVARISGDGSTVAFVTNASTVIPNDTNGVADVFVRDVFGFDVERVSVSDTEGQAPQPSSQPALSDDGRFVTFTHQGALGSGVAGEGNIYRRDRSTDSTVLVNAKNGGGVPNGGAGASGMSADGRWVSFGSDADDIVAGDTNGTNDVFLRDMANSTVTLVSRADNGALPPAGAIAKEEGLSEDGRSILFASTGQLTSATDAGTDFDLFVRDLDTNRTRRVSTGPTEPDPDAQQVSGTIDSSGDVVAFPHNKRLTNESFDQAYTNGPVDLGPFPDASGAINPQFNDFLGRSRTSGENTTWTNRFNAGQASLPTLIAALASDPVFTAKRAPLIRLYWAFFLRRPDPSGLAYWLNQYQGGRSLTTIAQSFARSNEFKTRYGTVSNQQYVKAVYLNVFGRNPDPSGLAYWTGKLDSGALTRGAVIVQFSESSEGKRRLNGPMSITLVALGMLRTTLSAAQWNDVYPQVQLGEPQPLAYTAEYILGTAPYAARYQ